MKSALKISIKRIPEEMAKEEMKDMEGPMHEKAEEKMEEMKEPKKYEKFELENAVRTLQEAMEIKQDEELMKAIEPMLEKKKKAIKSLDDLRAVAKEKSGSDRIESY